MKPSAMIDVRDLFKPLDNLLLELLQSLKPADWEKQTVAKQWQVKDVVSHLLDGNLRTLSMQRDRYFGEQPPHIDSYEDLVHWLNSLNADWVKASRRLSPDVLTMLHLMTGPQVCEYYESLDLNKEAIFSVDWAGESNSLNWMHLAREYTEKWHHQQQIRDVMGSERIMTRAFFYPCMDTFFLALPHTYKEIEAEVGTTIQVVISSEAGGVWFLVKQHSDWTLTKASTNHPSATVEIPPDVAWKLFTKSWRPNKVIKEVKLTGDEQLGRSVLEMVSVMA